MSKIKTLEEIAGEELCKYCDWDEEGHAPGVVCEGCNCSTAYELYVEENTPESKESMQEDQSLCKYCICTERGVEESQEGKTDGSGQLISCEGMYCDDAYAYYLVEFEEE